MLKRLIHKKLLYHARVLLLDLEQEKHICFNYFFGLWYHKLKRNQILIFLSYFNVLQDNS